MTDRVRLTHGAPAPTIEGTLDPNGGPAPNEIIRATLVLTAAESHGQIQSYLSQMEEQLPRDREYLAGVDLERVCGAPDSSLDKVRDFAAEHRLEIVEADTKGRFVVASGEIRAFQKAFQVDFGSYDTDQGSFRTPTGAITIPAELDGIIEAVLGLDDLPRFQPPMHQKVAPAAGESSQPKTGFTAQQIAQLYEFPDQVNGKGQTIAVILLGGGFHRSDLDDYFQHTGIEAPEIDVIEIEDQKNRPMPKKQVQAFLDDIPSLFRQPPAVQHSFWWTIEATLDIQLLGSFAPGAKLRVYLAPNTERGKFEALARAIVADRPATTIVSCSWGDRESNFDEHSRRSLDDLYQIAALSGITVCYSSGDKGDDDETTHYPASSTFVLSCGGTMPEASSPTSAEKAWNEKEGAATLATGGGYSRAYGRPKWQDQALAGKGPSGRGVPDVAGRANVTGGYPILVGGRWITMGGTSAAAPMWAGLVARFNESLQVPTGWLSPLLYRPGFAESFTDITVGNNGAFECGPGWDACSGLGTPRGTALLRALRGER